MNLNETIESYVRDVAACLPRDKRNDVAWELRALLDEELAARAQVAGHAADKPMLMALLQEFGRPADVAQRYHARPALIDAADTHHYVIWAVGGWVVLALHSALNGGVPEVYEPLLQWLGLLLLGFALAGWMRRRRPDALHWKPKRGPEWMPRSLSALALLGLLVFPVFMYSAPVTFARLLMPQAVEVGGLAYSAAFAGSLLHVLTLSVLVAMALQYVVVLVLGRCPTWQRRLDVGLCLGLGLLCIAHASAVAADGSRAVEVFASAKANIVAAPFFLGVGGMMLLFGLYYGWREWNLVAPAPQPDQRATA